MKFYIDINAAEGGEDAVLLVGDQSRILMNHIARAGGAARLKASSKG